MGRLLDQTKYFSSLEKYVVLLNKITLLG